MLPNGLKYYSYKDYLKRFAWAIIQPFWSLSPRHLWIWRIFLLKCFGAKVSYNVKIYPSCKISQPWNLEIKKNSTIAWRTNIFCLGKISIGKKVTISQGSHICAGTHDFYKNDFKLIKKNITIEDNVWIAADAFIGPGVSIGHFAVIGARSVVTKNIDQNCVVAGNPAKILKKRNLTDFN